MRRQSVSGYLVMYLTVTSSWVRFVIVSSCVRCSVGSVRLFFLIILIWLCFLHETIRALGGGLTAKQYVLTVPNDPTESGTLRLALARMVWGLTK